MTITTDIQLSEFTSDKEAISNGLRAGDFYIIKGEEEPYYLPKGTIKRVENDTTGIQQGAVISQFNKSVY
jgi:hypothetical protein